MLGAFLDLFRGRPIVIEGTHKIQEGQSKRVDIGDVLAGGKQIVLCRVDGELHALDVLCPHEGGRISDGPLIQGKFAMCPLHNYQFDPKTGKAVGRVCADARKYRVREKNGIGEVWV
jgi:nitrite reductase/ring-hydroxylating ferredoxin subunit